LRWSDAPAFRPHPTDEAPRQRGREGSLGTIEIVHHPVASVERRSRMTAEVAARCPTCGQRLESPSIAGGASPPVELRWRVQYWRNPVPRGVTAMELGVFTPEGELLYAAPLTEKNEQRAQAVVAAMNAIPTTE
jgi:hypothetical protein